MIKYHEMKNSIFGYDGNFFEGNTDEHLYEKLFDENGYLNVDIDDLKKLILDCKFGPMSDAVRLYYSRYIDENCGGNYTAWNMWRGEKLIQNNK